MTEDINNSRTEKQGSAADDAESLSASSAAADSRVNGTEGRWVYIKRTAGGNRLRLKSALSAAAAAPRTWKFWHVLIAYAVILGLIQLYFLFAGFFTGSEIYVISGNMLYTSLFAVVPIFIAAGLFRRPLAEIGLRKEPFFGVLGRGLLSGYIIYLLVVVVSYVNLLLFPQAMETPQEIMNIISNPATESYVLFSYIFLTVILAPLGEEIFFRGFLYPSLKRPLGRIPAMLMAGALFGFVHLDLLHALPLVVGGIALCWLYDKYNNIWINIIAHALWNAVSVLITLLLRYIPPEFLG